mmetsp:Transcript_3294/g.6144  ORF Transcript_3294/g.6144 Transcript_3294/m.6144 type:complete len:321 (-) Transcript_3294:242-1204(-)
MNQQYTFNSAPRAVRNGKRRNKYREDAEDEESRPAPANIMYDSRVIRGNTYATPVPTRPLHMHIQPTKTFKRNKNVKRSKPVPRASTPEPVEGRKHTDVQTDNFLEELHDTPEEAEITTQTDALLDYPTAPEFVPKPSGVEKETEILPGDLFDFDLEVEPILEVIVGKSLDHALMEVLEEEELKELKEHKRNFEQKRNTMLAEVQRIEAAEKRRIDEKERRIKQAKEFDFKQKHAAEKIKAQKLAKQLLCSTQDIVFVNLEKDRKFEEPIMKQIREDFLPWIITETRSKLDEVTTATKAMGNLMNDTLICIRAKITDEKE